MREIQSGINWIWYVTDTQEDAVAWFCELTGSSELPYSHIICVMQDGRFGFRLHR